MVFLEHGRIIEAEAVVHAAAAANGVLLQQPQAGGGFAGIGQPHAAAGQLGHQRCRGGGDAGEAHGQVEGGAFARHQGGGAALQAEQPLAGPHRFPIGHQQAHFHGRIEQAKQGLHQHPTAEQSLRLGDPGRPGGAAGQGRRAEVAAAQVFGQPGPQQGLQQRSAKREGGGGCGA